MTCCRDALAAVGNPANVRLQAEVSRARQVRDSRRERKEAVFISEY